MRYPVGDGSKEEFEKDWYVADYFGSDRGTYLHNGYDINKKTGGDTDLGFPLYAIAKGKLAYYHYASHPTRAYGRHNVIHIEGPWGERWVHYAHNHPDGFLSQVKEVSEGEMIAKIGKSGTVWAHSHFSIFKVDPKTLRNGIDTIARNIVELNDWWEDPLDFIETWYNSNDTPQNGEDMEINDQTKIDFGTVEIGGEQVKFGVMEVQRIRSELIAFHELATKHEKMKEEYENEIKVSERKYTKLKERVEDLVGELCKKLGLTQNGDPVSKDVEILAELDKLIFKEDKLENIEDNRPVKGDNWVKSMFLYLKNMFNFITREK